METLEASRSQFDLVHGATSCTSTSCLFARTMLERSPCKEDLNKILEAGAVIWKKWKTTYPSNRTHQTWVDVQKTYPGIFEGVDIYYETNGYVGSTQENQDFLLATIDTCVEKLTADDEPRSAIFTTNESSYGLNHQNTQFYLFDSHGSTRTNGNAYVLRLHSADDVKTFLSSNFQEHAEFSLVVLRLAP